MNEAGTTGTPFQQAEAQQAEAQHAANPVEIEAAAIQALETELAAVKAKAEENWDKALRAVADLENAKRRAAIDVANAHKYSLEKFAMALLPVMDSFEQALSANTQFTGGNSHSSTQKVCTAPGHHASDDTHSVHSQLAGMIQGIELTRKLFLDAIEKFGLVQIDPVGEPFNPEAHEAMSMIPSTDVQSNHVIQVFQRGYTLNGRVIRPARVIIAQ